MADHNKVGLPKLPPRSKTRKVSGLDANAPPFSATQTGTAQIASHPISPVKEARSIPTRPLPTIDDAASASTSSASTIMHPPPPSPELLNSGNEIARNMIQQQSQQFASMIASAASSNPQLMSQLQNKSPEDLAKSIEQSVLDRMSNVAAVGGGTALTQLPKLNPAIALSQMQQKQHYATSAPGQNTSNLSVETGGSGEDDFLLGTKQSSWIDLYARAYLGKADMVLPPLFTCLVALLFWAGALNFWFALFFVPIFFALSIHTVIVKGARIPPQVIPFSRIPAGVVVSLEFWAVTTFIVSMLPMVQDLWFSTGALLSLTATAYYLHYKAIRSDPQPLPTPAEPVRLPDQQRMTLQQMNPAWCWTCNIYKPIRSKHCSVCNRCFEEFDHHCPVVSNCITKANKQLFMTYLIALFAAEVMWMKLAVIFYKRVIQNYILRSGASGSLPSFFSIFSNIFALARMMPGTLYMSVLVCFIVSGTGYLMLRQAFVTAGNLTINEWMGRNKYEYLTSGSEGDGSSYYNPFDQGPVNNCIQFWAKEPVNWYDIYTERRLLNPQTATPYYSISTLLRARDTAKRNLKAAREQRQKQREEWLLQRYGAATGHGGSDANGSCHDCGNPNHQHGGEHNA